MKLVIGETEYDITESVQYATLNDLMKLKVKTKTPDFLGVTAKSIDATFKAVGLRMQDPAFEAVDLLGDEDFLVHLQGLVYLAKRRAGEKIEVDEAGDTPFQSITFKSEDEDVPDPKDPSVDDAPQTTT